MIQQQMPTRQAGNIHVVGGNRLYPYGLNTTGNSFHIPAVRIVTRVLMISFFLCLSGLGCVRNQTPTEPVLVELTRVVYEQEIAAIVTELVIPGIEKIKQLSRVELLLSRVDEAGDEVATFAVMLNHSDRVDPIPPGNFGVIIDPASDDRSIKNVASAAGLPGRFDHVSANGILLKQSVSGVVNGNLGISIWISPRDWAAGRYTMQTRVVKGKHQQAPWQQLGEFSYTGTGVEKIVQNACLVKPVFINIPYEAVMPFDRLGSVTLIRYERQPQDEGVTIKRWPGDTVSQYKYVEIKKQQFKSSDLQGGRIPLEPGLYQFKHNSVGGRPPSGYYGESNFFEIKPGEESVDIEIHIYPAI